MLGGLGWAGPAQLTGLDSAQKGVGQSRPNKVFYFRLGQTWPRQSGWAKVSLAHKHIRNGPELAWPSERNPSVLGQNRPGPALENQLVGGTIFPHPPACRTNVLHAGGKRRKPKEIKGEEKCT